MSSPLRVGYAIADGPDGVAGRGADGVECLESRPRRVGRGDLGPARPVEVLGQRRRAGALEADGPDVGRRDRRDGVEGRPRDGRARHELERARGGRRRPDNGYRDARRGAGAIVAVALIRRGERAGADGQGGGDERGRVARDGPAAQQGRAVEELDGAGRRDRAGRGWRDGRRQRRGLAQDRLRGREADHGRRRRLRGGHRDGLRGADGVVAVAFIRRGDRVGADGQGGGDERGHVARDVPAPDQGRAVEEGDGTRRRGRAGARRGDRGRERHRAADGRRAGRGGERGGRGDRGGRDAGRRLLDAVAADGEGGPVAERRHPGEPGRARGRDDAQARAVPLLDQVPLADDIDVVAQGARDGRRLAGEGKDFGPGRAVEVPDRRPGRRPSPAHHPDVGGGDRVDGVGGGRAVGDDAPRRAVELQGRVAGVLPLADGADGEDVVGVGRRDADQRAMIARIRGRDHAPARAVELLDELVGVAAADGPDVGGRDHGHRIELAPVRQLRSRLDAPGRAVEELDQGGGDAVARGVAHGEDVAAGRGGDAVEDAGAFLGDGGRGPGRAVEGLDQGALVAVGEGAGADGHDVGGGDRGDGGGGQAGDARHGLEAAEELARFELIESRGHRGPELTRDSSLHGIALLVERIRALPGRWSDRLPRRQTAGARVAHSRLNAPDQTGAAHIGWEQRGPDSRSDPRWGARAHRPALIDYLDRALTRSRCYTFIDRVMLL